MAWPTPTFKDCPQCHRHLYGDRWCCHCGWRGPEPEELEVTEAREHNSKLWIDLHHVSVGSEYNYEDPLTLSEEDARRLHDQLEVVLRLRRMPQEEDRLARGR